jgi:hypothetical protein
MIARKIPSGLAVARVLFVALLLTVPATGCRRGSHLPPRADGAAVVVTTPEAGNIEPGLTSVAEAEPNGTLPAAQKLDFAVATGFSVAGQIGGGGSQGKTKDVDLYRVVVPPPAGAASADGAAPPALRRRLTAEMRPEPTLVGSVEALDDAGQLLVAAGGGQPGEADGFPGLAVSPGTYFIRVRGVAPSSAAPAHGGYRLLVRLQPLDAGEELEPNGKSALATELPAPGEAVGHFGWRKDQDWYRVPLAGLAEGSVLSADLEAVPGVAASLLVFDSVERKLIEAHGRKEERVAVRNIRLPPGEPHLFLQARADSGRNLDVRYNLRVRTEVAKAGGELEPNDDAQHATPLADGTTLGYLARGDVDVYRFTAAEARELDIEAVPPERIDLKLEVIREPDGLLLVRSDAGKRHEPERLPNLFAPPGSLLVRLSGGKGDGNPDEPYRLTVTSHPPEPGAEREPNGSAAAATPLPGGATGSGLIYPRGDVDFWQAPATPDAEGNIAVTVKGIAGMTLELRVLSQEDKELGRFKISGETPTTNRLVGGGDSCCLLQIRDGSGKAANFRDRYTLTVGR